MSARTSLFDFPITFSQHRPPKEWPERPGFWIRREAGRIVAIFVSLGSKVNMGLPWHLPRASTATRIAGLTTWGEPEVRGWLTALDKDDLIGALRRASR